MQGGTLSASPVTVKTTFYLLFPYVITGGTWGGVSKRALANE